MSPYVPVGWYGYNERLSGILPSEWHIRDARKSIDFIRRNKDNRFYLEINFIQTHREDSGEFNYAPGFPVDPAKVRVPEYMTLPDFSEIRADLSKFYSQLLHMDAVIGDIMKALDDMGLAENTLVVFLGDNGPPYPGNKITLYDRGTGVPLILRWPTRFTANRAEAGLVNSIDIMPTILAACGIAAPKDTQGVSFLDAAEGKGRAARGGVHGDDQPRILYPHTGGAHLRVEIHPQLFRHRLRAGPEQAHGMGTRSASARTSRGSAPGCARNCIIWRKTRTSRSTLPESPPSLNGSRACAHCWTGT